MSTLAEIESAAAALSPQEKAELLLFVAGQLRAEGVPLPEPRLFSSAQIQGWMDEDEADMRKFHAGECEARLPIGDDGLAGGQPAGENGVVAHRNSNRNRTHLDRLIRLDDEGKVALRPGLYGCGWHQQRVFEPIDIE